MVSELVVDIWWVLVELLLTYAYWVAVQEMEHVGLVFFYLFKHLQKLLENVADYNAGIILQYEFSHWLSVIWMLVDFGDFGFDSEIPWSLLKVWNLLEVHVLFDLVLSNDFDLVIYRFSVLDWLWYSLRNCIWLSLYYFNSTSLRTSLTFNQLFLWFLKFLLQLNNLTLLLANSLAHIINLLFCLHHFLLAPFKLIH